jgi:hypothetical protein
MSDLKTLASAVNQISDDKFAQTGAGQESRAAYLNLYNTILRVGGAPGLQIDAGADISATEIAKKIKALSSPAEAERLGFRASSIASSINEAMPGGQLTKDAANTILASMFVELQKDRDFSRYYDAYTRKYGTALNVYGAFKDEMGDIYEKERIAIKKALRAHDIKNKEGDKISTVRKSAADVVRENSRSSRQFDERFKSPGLARYWGQN